MSSPQRFKLSLGSAGFHPCQDGHQPEKFQVFQKIVEDFYFQIQAKNGLNTVDGSEILNNHRLDIRKARK